MPEAIEAVYEHGVFRPLQPVGLPEGQHVSILLKPAPMTAAEAAAHLREWTSIFEGLTDEEVEEVEAIALDRSNFSRSREEDEV